jgi:hypothetical protein
MSAILLSAHVIVAILAVGPIAVAASMFNLLWVVVTVLMIVRPGSTTGV